MLFGSAIVVIGVPVQAFSIAAYSRGAGSGALDLHQDVGSLVMLGEILVVVGAIWAWRSNGRAVGMALAFLVIAVLQLLTLGDTDESGGWVNGLHGLLALIVFALAAMLAHKAARNLRA